jgi:hypothetical protein
LVVLCKKHHDEVHHGLLKINGYKESSDGTKLLDYKYVDKKVNKKKKYDENQINVIKNMYEEMKEHKNQIKVMIQELKKKDINISGVYIKKIVNNEY